MSYTTQEAINSEDMEFVRTTMNTLAEITGWKEEAQILKAYYDRVVNDWVE